VSLTVLLYQRADLTRAVDASDVQKASELLDSGPAADRSDPRYLAPHALLALAARTTNAAMVQLLVRHAKNDMENCVRPAAGYLLHVWMERGGV
jgi:hypothetical protein